MLYHYTSLATFALILTTKSIKFNRLDLVDDPDESLFGYGDSDMKLNHLRLFRVGQRIK